MKRTSYIAAVQAAIDATKRQRFSEPVERYHKQLIQQTRHMCELIGAFATYVDGDGAVQTDFAAFWKELQARAVSEGSTFPFPTNLDQASRVQIMSSEWEIRNM